MSKISALKFYFNALCESIALKESVHSPWAGEKLFAEFALMNSKTAVEVGSRIDTEIAEIALKNNVQLTTFEASPVFARVLTKRLKFLPNSKTMIEVVNNGVSDVSGLSHYYFFNQSFVKDIPFRTFGFSKKIQVVSLDRFYKDRNNPDFIKSDAEGLDIKIFYGARELLKTLTYFQLEMCSTDKDDFENLFSDFDLAVILHEEHPLWEFGNGLLLVPIEQIGWDKVFESMRHGDTNILCGVRKSALSQNFNSLFEFISNLE